MTEVGRVLGTDPAHPLEFWVGVADDQYLQLDDIVYVETPVSGHASHNSVRLYGVVDMVRSRYEGAKFDSDVFRISEGILPAGIATAAHVSVTRVEPELFIPPLPGQPVGRATGAERDLALYFDSMQSRFPAGLSREGEVIWGNLEFLDGTRGAHVNISGISGVATKTSYALFLLYGLFHSEALGIHRANARAVVFNVKGEDLMFADKANARLSPEQEAKYRDLDLPAGPFQDVALWSPASGGSAFEIVHSLGSRQEGIEAYVWSLREFCQGRLLRFMFAEADTETSQLAFAVNVVERYLADAAQNQPPSQSWVELEGQRVTTFPELVEHISDNREGIFSRGHVAMATQDAFLRRLWGSVEAIGPLIRKLDSADDEERHRIDWGRRQLNVIDINSLHDRAKRFVVGVVLKQLMEAKAKGSRFPLTFIVLDELNKYAPREGWSPIKELVLDIAERGRSLGVILIGAQQTASEVERRVVANCSFRIAGRLDTAEAERSEYGFLTQAARARASILKPGSMFLHQPEIPVPLLMQFPFPSWATRAEEATQPEDIPKGFRR